MNHRTKAFLQGVVTRFDALLAGQDTLELSRRAKLALSLSQSSPVIDSILENKALTVEEFCRLFPFDRARRGKAVLGVRHKLQVQTVGVQPLEVDIEAALSGTGDEIGILSPDRTHTLVLIVTVVSKVRIEETLFNHRYMPAPLLDSIVGQITKTIGAPFSFGFRLDTGVALVYRFRREVDSSVLEEEANAKLAVLSSAENFKVKVSFTEKVSFFVPLRGSYIGNDLFPAAYDPAQVLEHDPVSLFPDVECPRAPIIPPVLEAPPTIKDAQVLRLRSALLTHFAQGQRLFVEEFLSRLFDYLMERERKDYSPRYGVGAVSVSSRMLHDWHSDYGTIMDVLTAHDVLRIAGNHSNGDKCYTARDRCYRFNRTASVPVIDRRDLILRLQNSGLDRQIIADRLDVALRTLWRWFKDPEMVKMDKVERIQELLT